MTIFAALVISLLFVGVVWGRSNEVKSWNGGYCPQCMAKWEQFDTDSQGGRGYKDSNGHSTWISYLVDK